MENLKQWISTHSASNALQKVNWSKANSNTVIFGSKNKKSRDKSRDFLLKLIPQLSGPAEDGEGDQRNRKRNEKFRAAVAVGADVIQLGDFVERADVPDDHIENFEELAGSAPHTWGEGKRWDEDRTWK